MSLSHPNNPPAEGGEPTLSRLQQAREVAVAALLAERGPEGAWVGELSSSALSTATAVTALSLVARAEPGKVEATKALIARGFAWLVAHQNPDGGWGDTVRSKSNISTTTLVWSALALASADQPGLANATRAAEDWLERAAGALTPEALVAAIERRYGHDRTFSIPILTMAALCGRLGPDGWRRVRQLPFEVAVLPQRWFGALQLPVVSYALPALIAIGLARHGRQPSGNLFARATRNWAREKVLRKLISLQPLNGGFLEATPLTSFVTMSLAGIGLTRHPVVEKGVAFLTESARPDGDWPIDTNLTTWLTSLTLQSGILALPAAEKISRPELRRWFLTQQYRTEHAYTLAAPGGWAWTNLPGGVPDADDTPGALLALRELGAADGEAGAAGQAGVEWLLNLQNRDGGIPTFCRGWGRLPFDRSSPDLTAHAIRAWLAWRDDLPSALQSRVDRGVQRAIGFLRRTQRPDGAWVPLWFGHQDAANEENPVYGTSRVVLSLVDLLEGQVAPADQGQATAENAGREAPRKGQAEALEMLTAAIKWLVCSQLPDGGWTSAGAGRASAEETAVAVEALAAAWKSNLVPAPSSEATRQAQHRGALWLVAAVESGTWREPAPIGFYFAKLWYFERLYPMIFVTAALNRLLAAQGGQAVTCE